MIPGKRIRYPYSSSYQRQDNATNHPRRITTGPLVHILQPWGRIALAFQQIDGQEPALEKGFCCFGVAEASFQSDMKANKAKDYKALFRVSINGIAHPIRTKMLAGSGIALTEIEPLLNT